MAGERFSTPVGQQVFLWITNREAPLHDQADTDSRLEAFNQTQRNRFVLVNFAWQMLTPEKIAVFQHSPHPEISVGELHFLDGFNAPFLACPSSELPLATR